MKENGDNFLTLIGDMVKISQFRTVKDTSRHVFFGNLESNPAGQDF